ncbi:MAG TPA: hypothetical protein VL443_20250 [Cyclobacteriaceae bacterium]|jgi:hypothetical protein|nr:hypothetical protein [Cyclobacteriaceae bacterium]
MKKLLFKTMVMMLVAITSVILYSCTVEEPLLVSKSPSSSGNASTASIPASTNNLIAYYAFDATPTGGQGKLPITSFTDKANEIVMFEGTPWEVADSTHYGSSSSYILTINGGPYKYYKQIINDMKTMQARGVKVLWNIDDAASWNTTTPFTAYDGTKMNATQFASFVKTNVVDKLGLDGIALDVEHMGSTAANSNFIALVEAFGAYFGPKSSNPTNTLYTAAIYDGGQAGFAIGQSTTVAAYFNFVMDMGYSENNTTRFNQWANYIGAGKTMIGVSNQYNSLSNATAAAAWQPSGAMKAGIMVFAGNVNKPYTDAVFAAAAPSAPTVATNPSPANNATGVITAPTLSWTAGTGASTHKVYFGTSSSPALVASQSGSTYSPGTLTANTKYYWRIDEQNSTGTTTGTLWNFTTGAGTGGTPVSLSSAFNVSNGVVADGSTFGSTSGFDDHGYGYSSAFLGSSYTWNNTSFNIGSANTSNTVKGTGQTITLTSGKYSYLRILASAVNGNQASQSFVVNYSDGTTTTFTQSLSDWFSPQSYSGETKVIAMSYRDKYDGTKQNQTFNLYGYSFSLTNTKTISSIKLPNNANIRLLSITLVP